MNVAADFDPTGRTQRLHVVDVYKPCGGADDKCLARGEIDASHVLAGLERRRDFIRPKVDDRDRLVFVVRGNEVVAVMAHVRPPRRLADADDLHDLVLAGIDFRDNP